MLTNGSERASVSQHNRTVRSLIMSTAQGGYPPQGYPNPDPYGQQHAQPHDGAPQAGYETAGSPVHGGPPPPLQPSGAGQASRKKRTYAGQAFDFGSGTNVPPGGQPQGPAAYAGAPQESYGGYPQQPQQPGYPQAGYGTAPISTPGPVSEHQQHEFAGVGGYQPPDQGYSSQNAVAGMGGITNQFGQMNVGGQQAAAPRQLQHHRTQPLNQLIATDLVNQPFHVSELDVPPPAIILPQNVGEAGHSGPSCQANVPSRQALLLPLRPIARQSLYDLLSMLSLRRMPCSRNRVFLLLL